MPNQTIKDLEKHMACVIFGMRCGLTSRHRNGWSGGLPIVDAAPAAVQTLEKREGTAQRGKHVHTLVSQSPEQP